MHVYVNTTFNVVNSFLDDWDAHHWINTMIVHVNFFILSKNADTAEKPHFAASDLSNNFVDIPI